MSQSSAKPARRWWKILLILAAAAFVSLFALFVYINTESFQSLVRRRLVAEIERSTGGRAEIGSIHTIPFHLQAEVRNITVHGSESATDVPLAHADRVVARLRIISLLGYEFAFDGVLLDQPVIHIAFYSDGSTNFPKRTNPVSGQTSVEQLFALSIRNFHLRNGHLLWDDQNVPLNFDAHDLSLAMDYSYLHARYDGHLQLGLVDTKLLDCRPFGWMSSTDFSLASNSAEISSFTWNSGHSSLSAHGVITNFRQPHLQAAYEARLDLAEAASIVRRKEIRAGAMELKGEGNWSSNRFAASGLLTLRDLAWQDDQLSFSKASLNTGYSVTEQQLKLSKLQGRIFGGSITGEAELNQWQAPDQHLTAAVKKSLQTATISAAPPPGRSRPQVSKPSLPAIQSAIAVFRLRDLSAGELAKALNVPAHPLPSFHPSGLASGTIETRWKGTRRDAEIQFALDVTPPPISVASQVPLTVHSSGVFYVANDRLELPLFTVATPTSHVQASGTLSSTSALKLSVSTSSLADWLPAAALVRGPALFPIVLNGRASFNGTLIGALSSPQLSGAVLVNDFQINIPASRETPEVKTEWDYLATNIQLSFAGFAMHGASLRRGDTSADFDASATLQHGHLTSESNFNAHAFSSQHES